MAPPAVALPAAELAGNHEGSQAAHTYGRDEDARHELRHQCLQLKKGSAQGGAFATSTFPLKGVPQGVISGAAHAGDESQDLGLGWQRLVSADLRAVTAAVRASTGARQGKRRRRVHGVPLPELLLDASQPFKQTVAQAHLQLGVGGRVGG